jgi:serine/threonine protein kinase
MGVVYVVYDRELKQPLAAKTFHDKELAKNPCIALRFEQEALAWIRLEPHENVTQARHVLKIDDQPYLFMEFVSGGDLASRIGKRGLDLAESLRFGIQFCDGMTHVLQQGIGAHRDVKPQNCLISQDSVLKITDFGLAKVVQEPQKHGTPPTPHPEDNSNATRAHRMNVDPGQTGIALGTCTHMSPEQFEGGKCVGVRSDIYSFGVMLFQMLTGRLPFVGQDWQDYAHLHKNAAVPPVPFDASHLTPEQLSELNTLVQTCLAKDLHHRFADFSTIRKRLSSLYFSITGNSPPEPATGKALTIEQLARRSASLLTLEEYEASIDAGVQALEMGGLSSNLKRNLLTSLATCRERISDYSGAIADLTDAISVSEPMGRPYSTSVTKLLHIRGLIRCKIGDIAGAINDYTEVINSPDAPLLHRAEALFSRALARGSVRDLSGAHADLQCVLSFPDHPDVQSMKERALHYV